MTNNKFKKKWLNNHLRDHYVKLSKKDGYRSRAVYKLIEIDQSEKIIRPGQTIIDLGCFPGSWLQYLKKKLVNKNNNSINGKIIGLDLVEIVPLSDIIFVKGDFMDKHTFSYLKNVLGGKKADLILSDMSPNLSGISIIDNEKVINIADLVIDFAIFNIKSSGSVLFKCFNGTGYDQIISKFNSIFKKVLTKKPKASRDKSSEVYLLGKGIKNS